MSKIIFSNKLESPTPDTLYESEFTFSVTLLDDFNANTLELIESISKFVIIGKSIK